MKELLKEFLQKEKLMLGSLFGLIEELGGHHFIPRIPSLNDKVVRIIFKKNLLYFGNFGICKSFPFVTLIGLYTIFLFRLKIGTYS